MRVGYVLDRFPSIHQTFVLNEMLALEELGVELVVMSLLPAADLVHESVARLRAPVAYATPLGDTTDHLRAQATAVLTPLRWLDSARVLAQAPGRLVTACWLRGVSLAPVARALGITHVHAHFATGANVAAQTLAALTRVPFSFTMHAVDLYARPLLIRETLSNAKFGVTSTAYNLEHIESTYGADLANKVELVHACVDPRSFAEVAPIAHEVPVVLSVGRLIEKKGHADLIEALAIVRNQGVAFEAIIVGEGSERAALEALIARHALEDKVALTGSITQDQVRALYAAADIVALPSVVASDGDQDGIPVALIEALAVGRPVVSTTVSGIPELINEDVGILVPPHSPVELAEAIGDLLRDPIRRRVLGGRGPTHVRAAFDVAETAERMAELFAR